MGDDAKIPDQMPFYNTFRYVPTEISIATGGYDQRGTLLRVGDHCQQGQSIAKLSMDQLDRIFGSERIGGWEVGANADNNLLFTGRYARGPGTNIRKWGQLGLTGDWADKEIQTYGYVAPGFATNFERQVMHWSVKWNPNFKEFVEAKEATADAAGSAVVSQRMYEALEKDRYGIGWGALMHVNGTCVNPDASKCPGYRGLKVIALSKTATARPSRSRRQRQEPKLSADSRRLHLRQQGAGPPDGPESARIHPLRAEPRGQEIIQKAGVYSALPASYIRDQLKKLD